MIKSRVESNRVGWRVAGLIPGIAIIIVAWHAPTLRRPDGWLLPLGWALTVAGLATTLFLCSLRTHWQRCAGLFALALVGQACALQLLDSPPYSVYQHYFSWDPELFSLRKVFSSVHGLFLLALIGQTLVVVTLSRALWPDMRNWISRLSTLSHRVILVLFLAFAAALFSQSVFRYGVEVFLSGWIAIVSLLNLVLVIAAIPTESLKGILEWLKNGTPEGHMAGAAGRRIDQLLPWFVAAWVVAISTAIAWFVFERVPHIPDEISYLFQAKYFSVGRLYLPAPPDSSSFAATHVFIDGAKWFGYGLPGWPALLAVGVRIGTPFLVNPLLGGLTIILTHSLAKRLYGSGTAKAVLFLLALSPWFLFTSASLMPHTLAVVWTLLALLAVEKERASKRGYCGLLAGCCVGALFLTRPLEGMLIGIVVGGWALGLGGARLSMRGLAGLVIAGIAVGSLIFPYNYALTGDAMYAPHMKWADATWYPGADRLGFGADVGNLGWPHYDPLPGHGPTDVVINANKNFYMANFELFGWGFGSLIFAALAFLWGARRRADWVLLGIVVSVIAGHSFYWSSGGPDLGARYWYQTLVPLMFLTVRGVQNLAERLSGWQVLKVASSRVSTFVALASIMAFINVVPWRSLDKYYHYRGITADVQRLAQTHSFGNALVFIRAEFEEDYLSAFVLNPPTLAAPGTVYAFDAGAAHREAVSAFFSDRPVWFIGRSPTNDGPLTVLSGPFPPDQPNDHNRELSSAYSTEGPR